MIRSLAVVLLVCCAGPTTEQGGPRGLRAEDHVVAADREQHRADELASWPEVHPDEPIGVVGAARTDRPWAGTWDTTAQHQRNAEYHRDEAAQIQYEYEQACGEASHETVSVSPLQRYGIGGENTDDGTTIVLSATAGPPEHLLQTMRCHRAWMMLGRTDMDDCPLDLPGLHVAAHGDAQHIELHFTVDDPKLIPELQRRAAHDLEAAAGRPR